MARTAVGNIPIKFDATSNSGAKTTESTYSWSHTCTGNDRILIVGVGNRSSPSQSASSVTYNGVALTLIRADLKVAFYSELWYLIAPATGSNTVEVTFPSACLNSSANATSYTNVHQSSPIESDISTNGNTDVGTPQPNITVTTVTDNDWVMANLVTEDTVITINAGTQRNYVAAGPITIANSDYGPQTPAGEVILSWQNVANFSTWVMSGVALKPALRSTAAARSAASARTALASPNSIDFDGTDDIVTVTEKFGTTAAFTIEMWVYPDDFTGTQVFFNESSTNTLILKTGGNGYFQLYLGDTTTPGYHYQAAAGVLVAEQWNHVVYSYDGAQIYFYLNGTNYAMLVTGTPAGSTTGSPAFDTSMSIGNQEATGAPYDGKMYELRFWNKCLNATDITYHYNNPTSVSVPNTASCSYAVNCLLHYRMLEGTGTVLKDNTGKLSTGIFKGNGEPAWSATVPTGAASRIVI